ncbi:hypothetical protein [Streptomyces sp. ALB3]|uniref:hypothetical protein n=1 Tax=Streptomyces sp. ALB3 TaxID=3374278 RepID=UPI003796C250
MQEFAFRYRGPRGGLAVNLRAETRATEDGIPPHSIQIHGNIWLGLPASGLHWKDAAWLAFGVSLNAPALGELFPEGILVHVSSLECPPAHYRSEAVALAMNGWLHERFALRDSGAGVRYDTAEHGFVFTWGSISHPFADTLPPVPP